MNVSIVIPAYNEERNIERTLRRIIESVTVSYEVIVVTDHCSDRTAEIVLAMQSQFPQLTLLDNPGDKGFGNTLGYGLAQAQGEAVVPIMADCCDEPATINRMFERIRTDDVDVVCASRYMKGGEKIGGPFLQDKLSVLVCYTLKLLIRLPTWDCANSFKMYKTSYLRTLPFQIRGAGTEYSMAVFFLAFRRGARIVEIPTKWTGNRVPLKQEYRILKRLPGYSRWYVRFFKKDAEPAIEQVASSRE